MVSVNRSRADTHHPVLGPIEHWAEKFPDKQLFAFLDSDGGHLESYSYGSFLHRIDVVAGHLRRRYGFDRNDRLLLAYPPGLEMIIAFFACVRAGLIPVPIAPPNANKFEAAWLKMRYVAEDCQARAILTNEIGLAAINGAGGDSTASASNDSAAPGRDIPCIPTDTLVEPIDASPVRDCADLMFIQYTSGSTSMPKGVMVGHDNILHNCANVVDHETPVVVSWLPQYHDMGLIGYYIFTALSGGTTYGFSPTDFIRRPSLWFDSITKYGATASSAPNFAFEYCMRPGRIPSTILDRMDLSSLKFFMAAAEPIKSDTFNRFLRTFEPYGLTAEAYFVAYGLAENTLAVTNYGRTSLSVNRKALAENHARITDDAADIVSATHLMSCGTPLAGVDLRIVDPESRIELPEREVGEVWLAGGSKCLGYWDKPELTESQFSARIEKTNETEENGNEYLRTGDMGYLHEGELYICGRLKDAIIVRGQNYWPEDIENIVENATSHLRKGSVAAFEIDGAYGAEVAIVGELVRPSNVPDPLAVTAAVRNTLSVEVGTIAFVAPKSVPRTSSGKIMRHKVRQMWESGEFDVVSQVSSDAIPLSTGDAPDDGNPLNFLKTRYNLVGDEKFSLLDAGLDSLDLVVVMHEIVQFLEERGADVQAKQVDVRLIQQITIAELFELSRLFDQSPDEALKKVQTSLRRIKTEHLATERRMMKRDAKLSFRPRRGANGVRPGTRTGILLTGGTGFLGPFLLHNLLLGCDDPVHVLVRAPDEAAGLERLRSDLAAAMEVEDETWAKFDTRAKAVCGDLGAPDLGLSKETHDFLAREIHTIYHNAAAVNYLLNYDRMRDANVRGTNDLLRLAFAHEPKVFNYVSTTFIFGWATKDVLFESDANEDMELLDFGYSQSKWVAERVVADAGRRGLPLRIFRPALITPSPTGGGTNIDITIRLLAFMVKHGIGVTAQNQVSFVPADIVANNIVAIASSPETVNGSFHVTTDGYYNMMDILNEITRQTGRTFRYFDLPDFVPEVIKRCTRDDLLYPLLDFLIGSIDNITSMEFKRYDSSGYQSARNAAPSGRQDATLADTVGGLLRFMEKREII